MQLIFHPLSTLILSSGWLLKDTTAPWKCSLRVQWWNTFQLGPKKPPNHYCPKKIFKPQILKRNPSPLCTVSIHWLSIRHLGDRTKRAYWMYWVLLLWPSDCVTESVSISSALSKTVCDIKSKTICIEGLKLLIHAIYLNISLHIIKTCT